MFLGFLIVTTVLCLLSTGLALGQLVESGAEEGIAWVVLIGCASGLWFLLSVCALHLYLSCIGQTTKERFRKHITYNPYTKGCLRNCLGTWFHPQYPSRFHLDLLVPLRCHVVAFSPSLLAFPLSHTHRLALYYSHHKPSMLESPPIESLPSEGMVLVTRAGMESPR